MLPPRLFVLLIALALFGPIVYSHEESGQWHCDLDPATRLQAEFKPGVLTIDGKVDDWVDIEGLDFPLLPALDPDADKAYSDGKMTVKAAHDGNDAFFMIQVDGNYVYTQGESKRCVSTALMFQIGENASYHNMGGCDEKPGSCTRETCHGHEVDLMHFSIGIAIPGRLYGGNPIDNREGYGGDRFGHLVDAYAWNPHCRFLDGHAPSGNDTSAQNDWKGSWWHSILDDHSSFITEDSPYASDGQRGTYYFEFSRPLRTRDHIQQDNQFTIGQSSYFSAAFWYPAGGKRWIGSEHYSISCDWIPLDFISSSKLKDKESEKGGSWDATAAISLLFSVVAFCISTFIAYKLSTFKRTVDFIPMENL